MSESLRLEAQLFLAFDEEEANDLFGYQISQISNNQLEVRINSFS